MSCRGGLRSSTRCCSTEGAWIFLDGSQINVGVYRDSAMVATNDVGVFAEFFESAAFRGANKSQSYLLQMSLCASGASSAPVDVHSSLCASGS